MTIAVIFQYQRANDQLPKGKRTNQRQQAFYPRLNNARPSSTVLSVLVVIGVWTMPVKIGLATLALICAGAAVSAAPVVYKCAFSERSNRGPVPETLTIRYEPSNRTAFVEDEFVRQIFSGPAPAEVALDSPKKLRFGWQLVGLSYRGSEIWVTDGIVDYKVSINKVTGRANLNGTSREYFSRVYGSGMCSLEAK